MWQLVLGIVAWWAHFGCRKKKAVSPCPLVLQHVMSVDDLQKGPGGGFG